MVLGLLAALAAALVAVAHAWPAALPAAAALLPLVGALAASLLVGSLVRPLERLRIGVSRLAAGDLAARVPPTSRCEIGLLTRAVNELGETLQDHARVQDAFGRYASDWVLHRVLSEPGGIVPEGTETEVTLLFADVRSFTRLSEGMEAKDVVSLLNEVFQLASDCILRRGGTIDKFMGDAVMAWFGAPMPSPDHPLAAVEAARDLQQALRERAGGVAVEMGIGVHVGRVIVGTIGSDRRSDFTAIGDAVNVAQRLEALAGPGEVLVSEAVWRRTRDTVTQRFAGTRKLPGREAEVVVYAVDV